MKESHPIEYAEYVVLQDIADEPAFNWWILHVLKKHNLIISKVKARNTCYLERNQKFGIELPKSVKEAQALDKKNGNTLRMDALAKEMGTTKVSSLQDY